MLAFYSTFAIILFALTSTLAFFPKSLYRRVPVRCLQTNLNAKVEFKSYKHKTWTLTYRFKPAAPGYENEGPYLLIHPVGIGLSSWFWEKVLDEWDGPAVYAPNLIGCGISEGSDPWNPEEQGLSFPLGWAQGCETLMQSTPSAGPFEMFRKKSSWTVVSQGGLARVGVTIAARNPESVQALVLASPPTWEEMVTAVPEKELNRNYEFLKSPILGKLAFRLLESRGAIEFFSNQFLFSDPCDTIWLDRAERELGVLSRPPVMAFNAGFCQHRSLEDELRTLDQRTLILVGADDKRQRKKYVENMKRCNINIVPGQNVLPWESPMAFMQALKDQRT